VHCGKVLSDPQSHHLPLQRAQRRAGAWKHAVARLQRREEREEAKAMRRRGRRRRKVYSKLTQ